MSEQKQKDLVLCGAPIDSGGPEARSARLAVCTSCRNGAVKTQDDDGKVSERAGRLSGYRAVWVFAMVS
jgi:hypothetical protein